MKTQNNKITDIQSEYEKLFPKTTWSDEEIAAHMFDTKGSHLNEDIEDGEDVLQLDVTMEEYAKRQGLIDIDTILQQIGDKLK